MSQTRMREEFVAHAERNMPRIPSTRLPVPNQAPAVSAESKRTKAPRPVRKQPGADEDQPAPADDAEEAPDTEQAAGAGVGGVLSLD